MVSSIGYEIYADKMRELSDYQLLEFAKNWRMRRIDQLTRAIHSGSVVLRYLGKHDEYSEEAYRNALLRFKMQANSSEWRVYLGIIEDILFSRGVNADSHYPGNKVSILSDANTVLGKLRSARGKLLYWESLPFPTDERLRFAAQMCELCRDLERALAHELLLMKWALEPLGVEACFDGGKVEWKELVAA